MRSLLIVVVFLVLALLPLRSSNAQPTEILFELVAVLDDDDAVIRSIDEEASRPYTIEFLPDNTVAIQADCNDATGLYDSLDDDGLQISIKFTTLIECPSDSYGDDFLEDLAAVKSFSTEDDEDEDLRLTLEDGRQLVFVEET
jgi:hypothetical protein